MPIIIPDLYVSEFERMTIGVNRKLFKKLLELDFGFWRYQIVNHVIKRNLLHGYCLVVLQKVNSKPISGDQYQTGEEVLELKGYSN